MKYIVYVEHSKDSIDGRSREFDDMDSAMACAASEWSSACNVGTTVSVIESVGPDHFDGNYIAIYSYELFDTFVKKTHASTLGVNHEYACIEQAWPDTDGDRAVFRARAIRRGDMIDEVGLVPIYLVTWEIFDPDEEDEEDACDWLNPDDISGPSGAVLADLIRTKSRI